MPEPTRREEEQYGLSLSQHKADVLFKAATDVVLSV